ncbi:hypothetical protein SK128_008391, partial [Halocaridina rubra]
MPNLGLELNAGASSVIEEGRVKEDIFIKKQEKEEEKDDDDDDDDDEKEETFFQPITGPNTTRLGGTRGELALIRQEARCKGTRRRTWIRFVSSAHVINSPQ